MKKRTNKKSKFRGVSWNTQKKKWIVFYTDNGKRIYCGLFSDELLAHQAHEMRKNIEEAKQKEIEKRIERKYMIEELVKKGVKQGRLDKYTLAEIKPMFEIEIQGRSRTAYDGERCGNCGLVWRRKTPFDNCPRCA